MGHGAELRCARDLQDQRPACVCNHAKPRIAIVQHLQGNVSFILVGMNFGINCYYKSSFEECSRTGGFESLVFQVQLQRFQTNSNVNSKPDSGITHNIGLRKGGQFVQASCRIQNSNLISKSVLSP